MILAIGIQENHKLISEIYAPKNEDESITSRNNQTAAIETSIIVIVSIILPIHTVISFS
jgi:hypothetical protein